MADGPPASGGNISALSRKAWFLASLVVAFVFYNAIVVRRYCDEACGEHLKGIQRNVGSPSPGGQGSLCHNRGLDNEIFAR